MAAKEKKDLLEPCRYLGCLHILWPVIVYIVQISRPMCASLRIPQGNFICTFYRNIEACNSRVDSHPNPNQNPTSPAALLAKSQPKAVESAWHRGRLILRIS